MDHDTKSATIGEKLKHHAVAVWRPADKAAIANKKNPDRKLAADTEREEFRARQRLRELADEAVK